jgi:hypothetical protein
VKIDLSYLLATVTEHYLHTSKPMMVAEIAKAIKCSETTVRRVLNFNNPDPRLRLLDRTEVETPVRESSYRTIIRTRMTEAWLPSRRHLSNIILAYREAMK